MVSRILLDKFQTVLTIPWLIKLFLIKQAFTMFRYCCRFQGHRSEQNMNLTSIYTSGLPVPEAFSPAMLKSLIFLESNRIRKMVFCHLLLRHVTFFSFTDTSTYSSSNYILRFFLTNVFSRTSKRLISWGKKWWKNHGSLRLVEWITLSSMFL